MSSPSEEQILHVKQNLRNLINFNNELYIQGNTKIINAYLLLSLADNHDLGLTIGLNLLKGTFIALGVDGGIVGGIVANFMCGVVDGYAVSTPPSLNAQMSSLLTRFQATSEQLTETLIAIFYAKELAKTIAQNSLLTNPEIGLNIDGNIKVTSVTQYTSSISASNVETNNISASISTINTIIRNGESSIPTLVKNVNGLIKVNNNNFIL